MHSNKEYKHKLDIEKQIDTLSEYVKDQLAKVKREKAHLRALQRELVELQIELCKTNVDLGITNQQNTNL